MYGARRWPLFAGESVDSVLGAMAVAQPAVVGEPFLNRTNRDEHPRVGGRQKADDRHHQVGGVERVPADVLGEGFRFFIPCVADHGLPDLILLLLPNVDPVRGLQQNRLRQARRRSEISRELIHSRGC